METVFGGSSDLDNEYLVASGWWVGVRCQWGPRGREAEGAFSCTGAESVPLLEEGKRHGGAAGRRERGSARLAHGPGDLGRGRTVVRLATEETDSGQSGAWVGMSLSVEF